MKQYTKILATVLILALGVSTRSYGQDMFAKNTEKAPGITTLANQKMDIAAGIVDISPVVINSFSTLFPNATEQKWGEKDSHYLVYFLNNGRKAAACFSENGKMSYSITDCPAEHLPKAFTKKIKNSYVAYRLLKSTEIQADGQTSYQAILGNASEFLTLRYTMNREEEIQIIKR